MFIKRIREKFGVNNPIFTYEILETFKEYSKTYVFRLLNQSLDKKEILKFCRGVYFIPTECILGLSTIIQEDIVEKKYISNNDDVYGIYGGIYLENCFHLTTQVPNTIEIITNNESSRLRKIDIRGRKFILKKSRFKITKENYKEYTILELFLIISKYNLNYFNSLNSFDTIKKYIEENDIKKENLLEIAKYFPSSAIKKILSSGVLQ